MRERLRRIALLLLPPLVAEAIRWLRGGAGQKRIDALSAATAPVAVPTAAPIRKYWGLNNLDEQIEEYLDFKSGYFVELGANDGRLSSNTLYYEQCRNWHGILIEPAPNLFLQCRKNRSTKNHIICAACVSFGYKEEFVKILYSDSMSVSLNVETDIGDPAAHAEMGRQFLKQGETIFSFGAIARPLNSILIEANAPSLIDFLSLDVEGSELDVLKGVNHDAFKFRYMLIECRDIVRLEDYLAPLSYCMIKKFNEHDYLFAYRGNRQ